MGNCFSVVMATLNQVSSAQESSVAVATTFCLRLTSNSPRIPISKLLQPQSVLLPSLTNNTDDSKSHGLIIQNMQKLKLGKFAFKLATTATVELLLSQKLEGDDQASLPHYLIIVGFIVSCMLLYNGLVFGAINHHLGNILQLIGITLVLCLLCVLIGTFLPIGFSIACWVCAAFCLTSFLYILIKPHPRPYLERFRA